MPKYDPPVVLISGLVFENSLRNLSRLQTASRQAMAVVEIILLHIGIGDLCSRIWFGVVDNLAVTVLFAPTYIDKFTKEIFPME